MTNDQIIPADALELGDELRTALHRIFRRIRQESDNDPSGITLLQKMLLWTISQNEGIGVAELARMEKLRGPTISGHIKVLENAGLVRRSSPDAEDRRRVGLLLTEHGAAVIKDIRNRRRDWMARKLAQLPPEGTQALRNAITYLHEIGE
jgi:DNA-binding MarR family transcriptional regulator